MNGRFWTPLRASLGGWVATGGGVYPGTQSPHAKNSKNFPTKLDKHPVNHETTQLYAAKNLFAADFR